MTFQNVLNLLQINFFSKSINGTIAANVMLTAKQEVSPGMINCMCPETAFSLTPDSIQVCPISLQACKSQEAEFNITTIISNQVFPIKTLAFKETGSETLGLRRCFYLCTHTNMNDIMS